MEKLDKYRNYIEQIFKKYGQYKSSYGEVEVQTIFDLKNDHYQLLNISWDGN